MLQLQFASAFVSLSMDMGQFNRDFATLQAKLTRLPRSIDVAMTLNAASFTSGLDTLRRQLDEFRRSAQAPIQMGMAGGGGGRGGGGFAGFPEPGHGGSGGMPSGGGGFANSAAAAAAVMPGLATAAAKQAQEVGAIEDRYFMRDYNRRVQAAASAASAEQRKGQELQSIEDRYLQREYQGRVAHQGRLQAEAARAAAAKLAAADRLNRDLTNIEDRYLMSEYRGRVAHQARLAAEQKRAAAEAVALKKKQQADFITGVGTGAGMPFAMTPQMAAGQAAGMGMRFTVNQMQEAVKVAMSYETRLATLARVSGKTAEEMAELDQALVALSTQKGIAVPLGELVEFATQISKAGVSATPEILKMTETLAKLKILLPEMGAEQMSIAMVRVLKNFKLGSEHAEGFASALVRVDQESPATAQQIFNIANRLSGIAGASGASAAGVLSIAGGLAGMGNNAESASVSMGQMFTKMATDVEGFAKISGVSTEEFARAYREDPIKALQIFLTAFNKMEDTIEKAKFMESIDVKGQRSKQTMMTFAGIIDDTVARVPRLNEEMETGAALMASTGHEASKTEGSVTRLSNAFEALQKSVGNPLLGPLTGLIERLTQVTAWLERGGKAAYAFQGFLQAIPGIGNVANFLDYQSAQGQAGAGAGGAAKKLPAPPEKKVFTPPGEGLPGMPSMDLTKKQPAKGGEPAVEGVPFERQLQESLEATQKEVEKRYKTAMQAFESAKQARQHAIDLGKQFDETAREVAGAAPGEGEEKRIGAEVMRAAAGHANAASDKAKVASDQANKAFSAAQEQLKKLEQMDRERVAREGVQDVLFRGKGAVGAGIGMVRDWRKAAMQVAGEGLGLVADKLVPDKPKERLTIGRSVMDYAEKVTESVLNQDVDEAAKKTAEATTKSAIVLNDIKTLMQNGAALIQGGFAALGPP